MVEQFLYWTKHERDGSAEFVADVAEEDGLGTIELGECVGAAFFVFRGAGVVNGANELIDHEREKGEVFRIEIASGIDSADQKTEGSGLGGRRNRKDDGFRNRSIGGADRERVVWRELDDFGLGGSGDFFEKQRSGG